MGCQYMPHILCSFKEEVCHHCFLWFHGKPELNNPQTPRATEGVSRQNIRSATSLLVEADDKVPEQREGVKVGLFHTRAWDELPLKT